MANIVRQHWKPITAEFSGEKTKERAFGARCPELLNNDWKMHGDALFSAALSRKTPQNSLAKHSWLMYTAKRYTSQSSRGCSQWDGSQGTWLVTAAGCFSELWSISRATAKIYLAWWEVGALGVRSGGKHLERSLLFNDMQQMWNEAGAAPPMWSEREKDSGDKTRRTTAHFQACGGEVREHHEKKDNSIKVCSCCCCFLKFGGESTLHIFRLNLQRL